MTVPDDKHYRMVTRSAGNLVVFLGAGVNADGRAGSFQLGEGLPDDQEVARYLADRAELTETQGRLAEVAQRAIAIHGQPAVLGWLREMLVPGEDSVASRVHQRLAELPAALEAAGIGPHYQLIVTSAYDASVEQAFRAAGEEFDVAIYKVPPVGSEQPGAFVHVPYEGLPTPIGIGAASDYTGFPIARDERTNLLQMLSTLIVRTNGVVDHPALYEDWPENFVLTEDDYIGYLSGIPVERVVPSQILAKLRQANYLFLGFTLADWRLRVFLQRIWGGPRLGRAKYWGVAANPDELEEAMCRLAGVDLIRSGLTEYVEGLHSFLESPAKVLGT